MNIEWCVNATTTIDALCFVGLQTYAIIWGVLIGGLVGLLFAFIGKKE